MLMHLSGNSPPPRLPEQTALDMKMVLLTAPQVVISNDAQASVAPPAQAMLHKPEHVRLTQKLSAQAKEIPLRRAKINSLQPPQETHPEPVNYAPSTLPETLSASANGVHTSAAANTGSTAPSAMKGSSARIIAQPLPELPDDLREAAYRADALARFSVHVDGSVDVELLKATPYPRLNQMLLEALRKWRFFPAIEGGHPVESQQDVRVHFNVS